MKNLAWLAVMGVGMVAIAACGGGSDAGGTAGSTGAGGSETCDEASTTVSAGDVTIAFPMSFAPAQYAPACVKVHEGAKVTWNGAFADHPLASDGTSGNPITTTSTGTTKTFTFPAAGSFGFHCNIHPTIMHGTIFVVP